MSNTDNVIVSSRVRLARNFKNIPFPQRLNDVNALRLIIASADKAAEFDHRIVYMSDLSAVDRQALVEEHLISPDLAKKDLGVLLLNDDESVAVMINEEDHIRAQCIKQGFALQECYNIIDGYDDKLADTMPIAYDSDFGYLTACLTNVGTGMRASVMVFLPAMTFTGNIGPFIKLAQKRGITVRGVYGERSNPTGCLYQLSNADSIGYTEQALIDNVSKTVAEMCAHEQGLRRQLYSDDKWGLTDKVMRAYGILTNAALISSNEFMELVAYVKLGHALDIITLDNVERLDKLIIEAQPANLLKIARQYELDANMRDLVRATLVNNIMKELKLRRS